MIQFMHARMEGYTLGLYASILVNYARQAGMFQMTKNGKS
jgi:hypothetical protein